MPDASVEDRTHAIYILNDDQTPRDFVVALLQSSFGKSPAEAEATTATVDREGRAACGAYPTAVAEAILEDARRRIAEKGHPLVLASDIDPAAADEPVCDFCGKSRRQVKMLYPGRDSHICDRCLLAGAAGLVAAGNSHSFKFAHEALDWHFAGLPSTQLVSSSRQFPGHMRADLQLALVKLFGETASRFYGLHEAQRYETLTLAGLGKHLHHPVMIAAPQYHDLDIGEAEPIPCLDNGLWLCAEGDLRYAVMLSHHREYGQGVGVRVEVAIAAGEEGSAFVQRCFGALAAAISASRAYRGKILSLEQKVRFSGTASGITVHRLAPVAREDVILPAMALALLERNVLEFVGQRGRLRALGLPTKKGILLYGPPGTGKTHTIRYLAGNLAGHTTLIITAEQVGLLDAYMSLARLLQPTLVVMEDVDLIARSRDEMDGACEEVLLNKLLNEMDGLREDADIIFVLTTNRPQDLEVALAARPGRIDQAIEVPVPDAAGRAKLVRLYGRKLTLSEAIIAAAVTRTEGVSAAFIKELMRRVAQASLARQGAGAVIAADLDQALDDMLFTGGRLNTTLLGGRQAAEA
jgi:ATP-dependent Clp protease adapter protein ClpS